MNDPSDDRSSLAIAMAWVSRITTLAAVMVVPALVGYVVDTQVGTRAVFTIAGAVLGMVVGMWTLLRATRSAGPEN